MPEAPEKVRLYANPRPASINVASEAGRRQYARAMAREYGIDADRFERQIDAENGFKITGGSPAGAQDIAQFMPGTAPSWGVTLGDGDPRDDLRGAARYMAHYLREYDGSWEKALTAYNAGPGRVGGTLPTETRNYIAKILGSDRSPNNGRPLTGARADAGVTVDGGINATAGVDANQTASKALQLLVQVGLIGGGAALALFGLARMVGVRNPAALTPVGRVAKAAG